MTSPANALKAPIARINLNVPLRLLAELRGLEAHGLAFTRQSDATHHPLVCGDNVSRAFAPSYGCPAESGSACPLTVMKHAYALPSRNYPLEIAFPLLISNRSIRETCQSPQSKGGRPSPSLRARGDGQLSDGSARSCGPKVMDRHHQARTKSQSCSNGSVQLMRLIISTHLRGPSRCLLIVELSHINATLTAGASTGAARRHSAVCERNGRRYSSLWEWMIASFRGTEKAPSG